VRKAQFIINPSAGGGKGKKLFPFLVAKTKDLGLAADWAFPQQPREALDIALDAQKRGCDLLVACGGDGTIHALLPALVNQPATLGILPLGTANDLARSWQLPFDPNQAMDLLVQGRPKAVDVIATLSGDYIAGALGIGFDAAVVKRAQRLRRFCQGFLPFYLAIGVEFFRYRPPWVSVRTGDWQYEGRAWQILVTKIPRYASLLKITSAIRPDNGSMRICLVPGLTKHHILWSFPSLLFLGLRKLPGTFFLSAPQVSVSSSPPLGIHGDGDWIGKTPITLNLLPQALKVLMPPSRQNGAEEKTGIFSCGQ